MARNKATNLVVSEATTLTVREVVTKTYSLADVIQAVLSGKLPEAPSVITAQTHEISN